MNELKIITGAHSTDMQSPEDINDLYDKCKPYADRWVSKADELWNASYGCAGCRGCTSKKAEE